MTGVGRNPLALADARSGGLMAMGFNERQPLAAGPLRHAGPGRPDRRAARQRHHQRAATAGSSRTATCSSSRRPTPRAGRPARTRAASRASSGCWTPHTLAFPNYDGNGMYLSTGNVLVNPAVGLLFIDFERGHRMRLEGTASIDLDDPLRARLPGGPVRRPGPRAGRLPELPAVHPPLRARTALALRAARGLPDAGPGVEAFGLGGRRPSPAGPRDPGDREVLGR